MTELNAKAEKRTGLRTVSGVVLAVFMLTGQGCSWVPDYANPVEWYKGTRDWVVGEDEPAPAKEPPKISEPKKVEAFPNVNSVPPRPTATSAADREKMASGLAADRSAARYTEEQVKQGRDVSTAAPPPPAGPAPAPISPNVVNSANAPVPPALPPTPVRRSPVPPPPPQVAATMPAPAQPAPVQPAPAMSAPIGAPSVSAPANMVPVSPGGSVFVQADRFAPRFPAGTSPLASAGNTGRSVAPPPAQTSGLPVAIIYFGIGTARLDSAARDRIRRVFAIYNRGPRGPIQIVGHASSRTRNLDPSRHHLANFRVSNNRANAVATELIRLGVNPVNITVSAVADQQPAFYEVMPAGETGNRRAEIFFAR